MPDLRLFSDPDDVPWPPTADGARARAYLGPMMREGTHAHVANVRTRLLVLLSGDRVLPVTVNETEWDNCYVCSPHTHYVSYAREELRELDDPVQKASLDLALRMLGGVLRLGAINRTVHVDNWLVSTNLHPPLTRDDLRAITDCLVLRFPDHALAFRSLHDIEGDDLLRHFEALGYRLIASRQIYHDQPADPGFLNHAARKIWRRDTRLLERSGYEVLGPSDLTAGDLPRLLELYELLYIEKYSTWNPRFTLKFLETALMEGTMTLKALRKDGRIDGVLGFYTRYGTMTTPIFGYDTRLPQETGLYRMLSVLTRRSAEERGLLLNLSSGAAGFKSSRGARPHIEYSAIHDRHLAPPRRWTWGLLQAVINGIAIPILQHHRL